MVIYIFCPYFVVEDCCIVLRKVLVCYCFPTPGKTIVALHAKQMLLGYVIPLALVCFGSLSYVFHGKKSFRKE